MSQYKDLIGRLRGAKIVDASRGLTRAASELEIEAAAAIESLQYQLSCRIGVAKAEAKEAVCP